MSLISDENYINVQGWMVNKLHLKGNELLVYAVIYGYSQCKNGKFEGSLQYLADWCGATKQGILKNINSLLKKGLIEKEVIPINGLNYVKYYTTEIRELPLNKVEQGIKQSLTPIKQSLTNNIVNNIDNNTSNNFTINSKVENSEFLKHSKQKPKENLYDKCVRYIREYTKDETLRKLLVEFYNYLVKIYREKEKILYYNQFTSKLKKLTELTEDTNKKIEIVRNTLDNGWFNFYEVKVKKSNKYKFQDNIEPDRRDTSGKEFEEVNEGF